MHGFWYASTNDTEAKDGLRPHIRISVFACFSEGRDNSEAVRRQCSSRLTVNLPVCVLEGINQGGDGHLRVRTVGTQSLARLKVTISVIAILQCFNPIGQRCARVVGGLALLAESRSCYGQREERQRGDLHGILHNKRETTAKAAQSNPPQPFDAFETPKASSLACNARRKGRAPDGALKAGIQHDVSRNLVNWLEDASPPPSAPHRG